MESVEKNPNPKMQEIDEAEEEEEETLSLCDLPINSDATDLEYQTSSISSSSSEQQYFEFFSEEWNTTISFPPDNIVFCGKLIPYKQPHKPKTNNQQNDKKPSLFRWNSDPLHKSTTKSNGTNTKGAKFSSSKSSPEREKCGNNGGKFGNKNDILSLPVKSRWYLFFGLAKIPAEMELGDMRSRQRRKSPAPLFRMEGGEEEVSGCRRREKGLWGMIRALGCGGNHRASAVVKAALSCINSRRLKHEERGK